MKKKMVPILIYVIMVLGITGCSTNNEINKEKEPVEIRGISMVIKEGTLTEKGATVIINDINGKGTYVYGEDFRLDKKENDNWIYTKAESNGCAFTLMAYHVNDNGFLEFNQNWECMYGKLEKGTYRLVKSTFLEADIPITESDVKYFSVEFTIK